MPTAKASFCAPNGRKRQTCNHAREPSFFCGLQIRQLWPVRRRCYSENGHWRTCSERALCPQSDVNSTSDPCCTLHEWLVFPPCGRTEFYVDAAFSTLRAHAAGKPNSHNGLFLAVRCVLDQRPLCKSLRSHLLRHTSLPDLQPKITSLHELNICLFPSKKQRSAVTLVARYTERRPNVVTAYSPRTDAV